MALHIIIPSRYASTRLPGKALVMLKGKPMVQHVWERASMVKEADSVVVATDDERIYEVMHKLDAQVIMTSPELRSGSDRVAAAAQALGFSPDDLVINVQGDQPGIHPDLIRQTAQPLLEDPALDMATPVFISEPGKPHANYVQTVMDRQDNALYFSRALIPGSRDGEAVAYVHHIGLYAFRMRLLTVFASLPSGYLEELEKLEQLRVLEAGYRIRCVRTTLPTAEINNPEDVSQVEALL